MSYMTKDSINKRLKDKYEIASKHGELFGIFLQGSQNYIDDMFFEGSDVDSRAIYIPDKRSICLNNDKSKKDLILSNGEQISRFDIRKLFSNFNRPGINNLEILFTEYFIINEKYQSFYQKLKSLREDISKANKKSFMLSTMGISISDMKKLERRSGNEDDDIEKLGYSRKRLSNIMRFNATAKAYHQDKPFEECLKSLDQQVIHNVRRTALYSHQEAITLASELNQETYKLAKMYESGEYSSEVDLETYVKLEDLLIEILSLQF